MSTIAFLFPGQTSRYPGMLQKLVDLHEPNAALVASASEILGRDLLGHFSADNPDAYAKNVDVQIGVFLTSQLFLEILHHAGLVADLSLGLSLGEWNHLVHIGAIDFADALRAVRARGEAYDAGPRGWMAAVQPIELEELEPVLESVRHLGVVEAVNLNSPTQQVISGDQVAVEAAVAAIEDGTYARPIVTERSVPMHASTFEPVGHSFRAVLETMAFRKPELPYIPNRLAEVLEDPSQEQYVELLSTHVHRPVLWRASIDTVRERWPDVVFVEVGAKQVLYGLMRRKWFKAQRFRTDSAEDTAAHLAETIEAVKALQSQGAQRWTS